MAYNKVVAVDLDGVLAQYTGFKGPDIIEDPAPEARELLQQLSKKYTVILHTARTAGAAAAWLKKHNLIQYVTGINCCPINQRAGKPVAVAYIDDRAVNYTGDPVQALKEVERLAGESIPKDTGRPVKVDPGHGPEEDRQKTDPAGLAAAGRRFLEEIRKIRGRRP